jgi:diketogulonate reductase-like aldo/keto reductase
MDFIDTAFAYANLHPIGAAIWALNGGFLLVIFRTIGSARREQARRARERAQRNLELQPVSETAAREADARDARYAAARGGRRMAGGW